MDIKISKELYKRLSTHSVGFETHERVIEKLLDHYEAKDNLDRPVVEFVPNESEFKRNLIQQNFAWKELHFNDGSVKIEEWVASQFKETSSLRSNIWSGPLRDWKSKNVSKLILSIEKPSIKSDLNDGAIEIQVGKLIKAHIDNMISRCSKDRAYLRQLKDAKWCHDNLYISFPLLMSPEQIKEKGLHARYWTAEHKIAMYPYRFCSQFGGSTLVGGKTLSEQHGEMFLSHLLESDLLLPEFQNKQIKFIVKGA
ncbi:hypothetical protein F0249_13225 [Vibrio sp. 03-59-1]|uniref:hypothetical protein n=1 Tax=Vibrio sp. 03-59-1 TaxID=2607607 RepID=UPI0014938AF4|nr:hypothetical protein [Vibrio sp. 03-59-1]NOH84777.1 hypothetical protein [Vibrio sp. 03-59-1]